MQVTVCPRCGMKNSARARHCASCGAELVSAENRTDFPEEAAPVAPELLRDEEEDEKNREESREKKKKTLLIVMLVLAALLILALIFGLLVFMFKEGGNAPELMQEAATTSVPTAVPATRAPVNSVSDSLAFEAETTIEPALLPTPEPTPVPTPVPTRTPVPGATESDYFMFGGQRIKKGAVSVDVRGTAGKAVHIPVSEVEDLVYYCPDLTSLVLNYCYMDDYALLGSLTELTKLQLMSCHGHYVRDISFVENLTKLTTLNLVNNDVTDVTPLEGLRRLTNLNLGGNKRLSPDACESIGRLGGLRKLYLYSTGLTTLDGLETCKSLNTLNVRSNAELDDVEVVMFMPNLTTLQISGTSVNDFERLAELCGSVTELWVDRIKGVSLSDYKQLREMSSLKTLVIGTNDSVTIEKVSSVLPGVTVKYPD